MMADGLLLLMWDEGASALMLRDDFGPTVLVTGARFVLVAFGACNWLWVLGRFPAGFDFRFGAWKFVCGWIAFRIAVVVAADMGVVEVAGCRFEFRRILFWENVEGWEGVVCGARIVWTVGDFGFRGAGGSWYGTIFLYVSACACALCACVRARARGKTFEVDPRLFSGRLNDVRHAFGDGSGDRLPGRELPGAG